MKNSLNKIATCVPGDIVESVGTGYALQTTGYVLATQTLAVTNKRWAIELAQRLRERDGRAITFSSFARTGQPIPIMSCKTPRKS